jgi:hypothetical protein
MNLKGLCKVLIAGKGKMHLEDKNLSASNLITFKSCVKIYWWSVATAANKINTVS